MKLARGRKIDKKLVMKVLTAVMVLAVMLSFCGTCFASNANGGGDGKGSAVPWDTALTKLVDAFSGKTAMLITAIGLFVLAGMAIFGGDLGVVGKGLMMVIISGSLLTGLMKVMDFFFGKGCCL